MFWLHKGLLLVAFQMEHPVFDAMQKTLYIILHFNLPREIPKICSLLYFSLMKNSLNLSFLIADFSVENS